MASYRRDTTPALRKLASQGQSFTQCMSHTNWTLASTTSILTGTYPSHHGVGMGEMALPTSLTTAPALFSDSGYHTACLSRNTYISETTDLVRDFDEYEWIDARTMLSSAGLRTSLKYLLNIRRHSAGFDWDTGKHSTPFLMNDVAKRWISRFVKNDSPFFFYLHYNEPHRPYYPPLPYLKTYTEDIEMSAKEAAAFSMDVHYNAEEFIANGCDFSEDEWDALYAMYDAEIRYTDECLRRLYSYANECVEDLIFVVTSDHGQLFGEQDMLFHKNSLLHDGLINVPLVVSGLDEELVVDDDDLVQHADLMQTLCELYGSASDQFQGVNLTEEGRQYTISQRSPEDFEEYLEYNEDFDTNRYPNDLLTALRTNEYKYYQSDDGSLLHNLPDEDNNVLDAKPEIEERLGSWLSDWLGSEGKRVSDRKDAEFSEVEKSQLRELGYLE